jgi:hypothetical protein
MNLDYSIIQSGEKREYDSHTLILTRDGDGFVLSDCTDILERCRLAVSIEKSLVKDGTPVTYLSESNAIERLKSNSANFLILIPPFTKDTIRRFGLQGLLLPHKVTRHVIPSRPLAINVPLSLLRDPKLSRQQADEKLGELLSGKNVDRRPPGSVVDGRRYDEELLIFSQSS